MKKIVFSILFATVFALALSSDEIVEKMKKFSAECAKEHGVSEDEFHAMKSGDINPDAIKDNVKCAFHCIMMKSDHVDDHGKIKPDSIRPEMNSDEVKIFDKAFEECDKIEGKDPCDTAVLTFDCMMKHKQ